MDQDIIYSKSFKKWFGDWENDPKNSSKVIDENGKPLTVYHGSYNKFDIFKSKGLGIHFGTKQASEDRLSNTADIDGEGLDYNGLLNSRKRFAKENGVIYPCFLNIRNPFILEDFGNSNFISSDIHEYLINYGFPKEEIDNLLYKDSVYLKDYLISKKFDGIFYKNRIEDSGSISYIVFYPNQIKSAINNNGNFSKESDNINEKILHKNNKWIVTDHTGEKNLGTYSTKEEAEKRLKQIEYFKNIDEKNKIMNNYTQFFDKYTEAKNKNKLPYGKNTIKVVSQYLKNNGYQVTNNAIISGCNAIYTKLRKHYNSYAGNYGVKPTDTTRINNILATVFPPKQNTTQTTVQQSQVQTPQDNKTQITQNQGQSQSQLPQNPEDDPIKDLAGISMLTKDELRAMVNKGPLSKIMAHLMSGKTVINKIKSGIKDYINHPKLKISNIQITGTDNVYDTSQDLSNVKNSNTSQGNQNEQVKA